uniref:Uncharacterized protein MANES_01G076800 n=1 Tax=Rhizophora mucronata TaxID=61149 RepID=A0A2P2PJ84_RHIMU
MEIAEEKEGLFEGVSPRRVEQVGEVVGVGGSGEVERVVVGEEMVEEEVEMGGEEIGSGGWCGEGLVEEGKESVLQCVEPLLVVVLES